MSHDLILYAASVLLALIPALIWISLIFGKTKRKGIQILLFIGSIFSVVPIFGLQYFLLKFPQFDIVGFLQGHTQNQNINFIILFIFVGITEEIVKQALIRFIDKKYLLIETINESIRFSLIGALGFSFAENIFYIYNIWTTLGIQQLFIAYLFRSVFTTCAHLIFSGFFGYYYGVGKFALNITEQSKFTGKKLFFTNFLSRIMNMAKSQTYKQLMILKGLFIAITLHAFFNFLLQLDQIIPVVIFVIIGYYFLHSLLKQKSGQLILITDVASQQTSTMAKTDEEVVIELMGMWFKQGRYVDVIHICERLLKRDPDNKIIQLFKAQAGDKMDKNNVYAKILNTIFPKKEVKESIAKMVKEKYN